jgi:predicted aconitase with swiveling domain
MKGRMINPGKARAKAIVSREPIGFYGGINAKTGIVIEKGHELEGESVKGKVLVFPCGKGSTVGSYVIYGLAKNGVAPAAIINKEPETIVATGAILAGIPCIDGIDISKLKTGDMLEIDADKGSVKIV